MSELFAEFESRLLRWMAGEAGEFSELALQLFRLHYQANLPYQRFCDALGRNPATVRLWTEIPAVPTAAFKEFELSCLAAEERTAVFHSSGTTAQVPSQHFHNARSLRLYESSVASWFSAHLPLRDATMIFLTPPPKAAPHSSLVHMFETLRRHGPAPESRFVGRVDPNGDWAVDVELATGLFEAAERDGTPIGLLGTAFNFVHLADAIAARQRRFALPGESWALETGGYKGRSRTLVPAELHGLIQGSFGIDCRRIVREYGMCELSSQAYDRSLKHPHAHPGAERTFGFPPWVRTEIVSPETGRALAEGQPGLLRIYDLANVYSVLAIETQDLAVGQGSGFELLGRAERAEPRGCSLITA